MSIVLSAQEVTTMISNPFLLQLLLTTVSCSSNEPTFDLQNVVNANVVSFEQDSGCGGEGYSIGGSPSCFTIGDTTELYLCDKTTNQVLISVCSKTDCSGGCGTPVPNWYGYVDSVCQENGWLQTECTDELVDVNLFV